VDTAALARAQASRQYAEDYVAEDDLLRDARNRGQRLGCTPVGPGGGATLRFLAALLQARSVVEIGTGAGVSGLWLLRGMREDGILTSVDVSAENQRNAREIFAAEGVHHSRIRLITGRALDVLPRLTDAAYDLVLIDAAKEEYGEYLTQALRLLRPGGVVAIDNALWHDRTADPAQRDPETIAVRAMGKTVLEDERLVPVLLPVGDGLLAAVRRPDLQPGS
jgi:predicted O-methyltransferase YrrM